MRRMRIYIEDTLSSRRGVGSERERTDHRGNIFLALIYFFKREGKRKDILRFFFVRFFCVSVCRACRGFSVFFWFVHSGFSSPVP